MKFHKSLMQTLTKLLYKFQIKITAMVFGGVYSSIDVTRRFNVYETLHKHFTITLYKNQLYLSIAFYYF